MLCTVVKPACSMRVRRSRRRRAIFRPAAQRRRRGGRLAEVGADVDVRVDQPGKDGEPREVVGDGLGRVRGDAGDARGFDGDHLVAGGGAFAVEDGPARRERSCWAGAAVVRARSAVAAMAASELSLDMAASPRVVGGIYAPWARRRRKKRGDTKGTKRGTKSTRGTNGARSARQETFGVFVRAL